MSFQILNYGYGAVLMLSLVVFIEIALNFKRPLLLKTLFLLVTFCLFWRSAAMLYTAYAGYNRWILELPGSVTGASALCLFSVIYQYKVRRSIIAFGIFMVALQVAVFFYYSFIEPVSVTIHPSDLPAAWFLKGLRFLFVLVIMAVVAVTFSKITRKFQKGNIYFLRLKTWTVFFTVIGIILSASHIINSQTRYQSLAGGILTVLGNYCALLLLLFRPRFLNHTNLKLSMSDHFSRKADPKLPEAIFMEAFFNKAYYLDKSASAEGLARQLNVTLDTVQEFIYTRYGSGFTDLTNRHRVAYFVELVNTGNYGHYTIDALAQESGFSSRHHLYKPFKKFHGGTPSDFIQSVVK